MTNRNYINAINESKAVSVEYSPEFIVNFLDRILELQKEYVIVGVGYTEELNIVYTYAHPLFKKTTDFIPAYRDILPDLSLLQDNERQLTLFELN